ncbi:MAG: Y-family DNA polymerase [Chitinophagaceae bacterium]
MIALADINNFYASCEKMFDPSLNGRPVIVLSNNDGCTIARSEEAKALGVKMGSPALWVEQHLRGQKVAIYSSNYTLYGSMSDRVMKIFRSFVARVEVYSIDEAFLDLSHVPEIELYSTAAAIRKMILEHTGLIVSIGVAPTKALAKMANHHAKKNYREHGVWVADTKQQIDHLLNETAIDDVWGIGWQYQKFLKGKKVHTAKDFVALPDDWVKNNLTVVTQRLLFELRGIQCFEWEESVVPKKNIRTSRSFQELLTTFRELQAPLASHAAACAKKLRDEKSCAKSIQVFIQTNPFRGTDKQYAGSIEIPIPVPTNNTQELVKYAMRALQRVFKPGYNYHKCGVTVQELVPQEARQLGLFDQRDRVRDDRLMQALDQANSQFGKDIVRYATQGYETNWHLRAKRLSPRYTTRMDEIMVVKA